MRSRWLPRLAAVSALAGALACAAPSDADNGARLKLAVEALRRAQQPSGLLRYDFDFLTGASSGEDNAVRQASAMAFLAEHLRESRDASLVPALRRGLERLDALSVPLGKGRVQRLIEWTGLLSVPTGRHKLAALLDRLHVLYASEGAGAVVSLDRNYAEAWAGATALALLAELQYSEATGDARFEAARARWLHGLAALYVSGLGFRASPTLIHTSPFADGQGWLALASYERSHPGHPVVKAILPGLEARLMREHARTFSIAFYQWGTMAAAVRWDATRDARFVEFIAQQARETDAWLGEPRPYNTCAPVEGLATAARVLRDAGGHAELVGRIARRSSAEMQKNYELQIVPAAGRLQLGSGVSLVSPRLDEFAGAFLAERRRLYTRIDFTRHCMTAMERLERLRPDR